MLSKHIAAIICASTLMAVGLPALAQTAAAPAAVAIKKNMLLADMNGRKLGKIFEVNTQKGYVTFLAQMKIYRVPLATITDTNGHLTTSMAKADLGL